MAESFNPMESIAKARIGKRKRVSSYDKTGGNDDRIYVAKGDTAVIADIKGQGVITHIWMTLMNEGFKPEKNSFRNTILRFYWDGETIPSVEVPIGDFYGMGHGMSKNFVSAPLQMSPEDGKGFNCWWPMPFSNGAKVTVENDCDSTLILYFYFDYEEHDSISKDLLRFHSQFRRECLTQGKNESDFTTRNDWCFSGKNVGGEENYVVMTAKGKGHYCGCNVNIDNVDKSGLWSWPGEGDDMIFIDGEKSTLNGTGTEDYVNMAWCPTQEYSAPYHGLILGGKENWKGKITYYRYHIADPIMFDKDIKVTIEHGHCNHRSDDWSTTAYWYQTEPHMEFPQLPDKQGRKPLEDEDNIWGNVKNLNETK